MKPNVLESYSGLVVRVLDPGTPDSKALGGSKVDSACYSFEVD